MSLEGRVYQVVECRGASREIIDELRLWPDTDPHGHDDGHRDAIDQRGRVDPLTHGIHRGLVEQRDASHNLDLTHSPPWAEGALENHRTLDPRPARARRIDRLEMPDHLR